MMEKVLSTHHICKYFKKEQVLRDLNLLIKAGEIYGLIGENGAGKTTFMRIIAGLAQPSSGSFELYGKSTLKEQEEERRRIGVMIGQPRFYENLTAVQNLEIIRRMKGIPGQACISKVMQVVGLEESKKKISSYSLGMHQRLGIAAALLGDPEFLILDEPINNLDARGMLDMRSTLKHLNEYYGVTILVSSHILSELQQIATTYGILHKGSIIKELTHEELNKQCKRTLKLQVDNVDLATGILEKQFNIKDFEIYPENIIRLHEHTDKAGQISTLLVQNGIVLRQLVNEEANLSKYFLETIGGADHVQSNQ